jgi:hypothetical protein
VVIVFRPAFSFLLHFAFMCMLYGWRWNSIDGIPYVRVSDVM